MKNLESKTVWKDGKLVTMYKYKKAKADGIFGEEVLWFSQNKLDYIQRQEVQEREGRRLNKLARERK